MKKRIDIKILSGVCWAIASCLFLWMFSLSSTQALSVPPTISELFNSFIVFSFILLGGGGCYHFLTEIIATPLSDTNRQEWIKLTRSLTLLMFALMSAPIITVILRENVVQDIAFIIALIYYISAMLFATNLAIKIEKQFKEVKSQIKSNQKNT